SHHNAVLEKRVNRVKDPHTPSLRPCESRATPPRMLRRALGLLPRPIAAARARSFSTDLPAAHTADATFMEAWNKVMPNMDPPKTPLSFMHPRPPTPSSIPPKLTVNFVLPYASELSTKEVTFGFLFFPNRSDF
ncbi:hypothetical protein Goklo_013491, partial [Gossypium klotzschianum]|nr:hypothetical protein [Gossypium klotzschianum]